MMRSFARTLLIVCVLLGGTAVAVHARSSNAAGDYQFDPNPNKPVFIFGQSAGFSPVGAFQTTIYGNGKVTLDDLGRRPSGVPLVLRHPRVVLSAQTLQGLMTLARGENFLALPDDIAGHPIPDLPTRSLTLHTATTTKTVTLRWMNNARFEELYAVLAALTPRCFKPQTGPQVCHYS